MPMGGARLRISAFPQIGDGPNAVTWDGPAPIVQASTSSHFDPPSAVFDGLVPASSADRAIPRFLWPQQGGGGGRGRGGVDTSKWIEYRYSEPRQIASAEVYWAEDAVARCAIPSSWSLQWWDGSVWIAVEGVKAYPIEKDRFSQVHFTPVRATAIRLQVTTQDRQTAGILQWRVSQ